MSRAPLRVPLAAIDEGARDLIGDAFDYVIKVHRLRAGDAIVAFDPARAIEAEGVIDRVEGSRAIASFGPARAAAIVARRSIVVIQGSCKGDKMDAIVRDATELGATRVTPAICERSIARPDAAKADRWRRIAVEAARQCGRGDAPRIDAPSPFANAIEAREDLLGICLDPAAAAALGSILAALPNGSGVAILVGPEGGLSPDEIALAEARGFVRASIGPFVLRAETVCAAVLGAIVVMGAGARPLREG